MVADFEEKFQNIMKTKFLTRPLKLGEIYCTTDGCNSDYRYITLDK